jgi:hypothetical protein
MHLINRTDPDQSARQFVESDETAIASVQCSEFCHANSRAMQMATLTQASNSYPWFKKFLEKVEEDQRIFQGPGLFAKNVPAQFLEDASRKYTIFQSFWRTAGLVGHVKTT